MNTQQRNIDWIEVGWLLAFVGLALALRLQVWQWREFYPLGGDEREYMQQALTLLREHRYTELRLMRPPLYGFFLAGNIYLFDSLIQNLRLVQAILSAATVVPVWLLTGALQQHTTLPPPAGPWWRRPLDSAPLLAALLAALSYTLAAYATELLTETVFLLGLTVLLWLLVRAGANRTPVLASAAAGGVVLGLLCLTRSVGIVLLPLGALWLLLAARRWLPALLFALAACLLIVPWTARNYATYGAVILIDTTGAENLWLDNDPAGREAVKAQLYAMGEDRAARQQLATQRGLEVIAADPQRFAAKAGGELLAFFALEHTDDLRARPVIWQPPAQVGLRLLLGDALWLLLLLGGAVGFCAVQGAPRAGPWWRAALADPRWLPGLWALYTLLTALIFHVELRYRLPLYPVLLPYAALALVGGWRALRGWRGGLAALLVGGLLLLTLLHRPYPLLAWQLGWKHLHLAQAEQALAREDAPAATAAARAALAHDPDSVLARVALAQAAHQQGQSDEAEAQLRAAIDRLPAHPQPHLLLGDLLRQQGQPAAARDALAYETSSLQDLQAWSWERFTTPPTSTLDLGDGLALGHIRGWHPPEADPASGTDWRWTTDQARLRLAPPATATPCPAGPAAPYQLVLRLAPGRPPAAPAPTLTVQAAGQSQRIMLRPGWQTYRLPLPADLPAPLVVTLRSPTFTPRTYDPASPDGRRLGVQVDSARLLRCAPNT